MARVGLVAIGRNEGERLRCCLVSAAKQVEAIVYVDSGSEDQSVAVARGLGAEIVGLDMSAPFSAARARNEGFEKLQETNADLEFVQFIDGDCMLVEGWVSKAVEAMENPRVAVVCGRRREQRPSASIYNLMCDMEWDTEVGEVESCGGDALVRALAFREIGGFNPAVVSGEEPELCHRLRQRGWKILRIEGDMTLHDAAIDQFSQWWKRAIRAGHGYAQGVWLCGCSSDSYYLRDSVSVWVWGGVIPVGIGILAVVVSGWSLLLVAIYPLQVFKIFRGLRRASWTTWERLLYAGACVLSKFPGMIGQVRFYWSALRGRGVRIIEYKGPNSAQRGE